MHCLADSARKMMVGRRHLRLIALLLYCHDALQGVFGFFAHLLVLNEVHDFVAMPHEESAAKVHETRWAVVANAMAGRTHSSVRVRRRGLPLPSPFLINSPAIFTNRGLG
jgi:hypothetical protein